ncbi:MAG TPA: glycosyltransferase family 39 protein [Chthoniobacterales bacterium]|nr:glycosyltransferase family 39 protein [Chthoniobacterales bacterium]
MVAGARTFSLEDTFLSPQILNPPPTRHALLAFLLALAAVFHIGTAAWGDLTDGIEGQIAAGAREMVQSRQWLLPTNNGTPVLDLPPLTYWTVAASYKIFGVSTSAARIPIALVMIGSVALTFLIGERLAGYWRGFAAGLLHVCSFGGLVQGRIVSPGPVTGLFVAGAIYCAVCGYQHRKRRRVWFATFAFCTALACLSGGLHTAIYPVGVCLLLAFFYSEARTRFRPLLHWPNVLLYLFVVAPWFVWVHLRFPGFWDDAFTNTFAINVPRFLRESLTAWFPALFLILPGLIATPRKIFRPDEFDAADALPLIWIGLALLGVGLFSGKVDGVAAIGLPAFALFGASAWQRISRGLRTIGIILVLLAGLAAYSVLVFNPALLEEIFDRALPDWLWFSMRPLAQIGLAALLIFSLGAAFAASRQRAEVTLLLAIGAMAPIGFCVTEGRSRSATFFSLADAAQYLNPRLGTSGSVVFEGDLRGGSSLSFYLEKRFFFVNQRPGGFEPDSEAQGKYLDEHSLLEAWERSAPIYLIIEEERVSHWRKSITQQVHIYHQVTTCGSRVILSNQL